jgi:hypothetical protein
VPVGRDETRIDRVPIPQHLFTVQVEGGYDQRGRTKGKGGIGEQAMTHGDLAGGTATRVRPSMVHARHVHLGRGLRVLMGLVKVVEGRVLSGQSQP